MTANSEQDGSLNATNSIDHLVFAASDLETGMSAIESLLGVQPVLGGRHPDYGTHNALLSLGPDVYLEVIAPDPDLPAPENGALFSSDPKTLPKLVTWVLQTNDIEATAKMGAKHGIGPVQAGSRQTPSGTMISWQLTDPYAMPLDGAIPFLIDWGSTPHPAKLVPTGGKLVKLSIVHPQAPEVEEALDGLNAAGISVLVGDAVSISAQIETLDGRLVELK